MPLDNTNGWTRIIDSLVRGQDLLWVEVHKLSDNHNSCREEMISTTKDLGGDLRVLTTKYGMVGLVAAVAGGLVSLVSTVIILVSGVYKYFTP